MKILAIRGKNLASLGDFCLDFQQEPLASAGLFAITGATGAGKSTILDALCLALYNQTPRLARIKQGSIDLADVGEHRLTIHNPQTLLRRGAIEGFAEVDFLGNDNIVYRAKWNVRRARGHASGKLQDEQLSLLNLYDNTSIGHKKTEVQKAIQDKIGLSFEEFNRAVLLAQNEFFAFLKSEDNERASLLEALTGSSQFTDLSIQAFRRAKEEKDQLALLHAQLAGQIPLSEEQRTQLELSAQQLEQQVLHEREQSQHLTTAISWLQTENTLQQKIILAEQNSEQAQTAWQNSHSQQQFFLQVEAIQPARPLIVNHERLQTELSKQENTLININKILKNNELKENELNKTFQQATHELNRVVENYEQNKPRLEQAKKIDTLLETQQQRVKDSENLLLLSGKRLNQSSVKSLDQWQHLQSLLTAAKTSLSIADNQAAKEQTLNGLTDAEQQLAQAQIRLNQFNAHDIAEQKNHSQHTLEQLQQTAVQWRDWQTLHQQQLQHTQEISSLQQRQQQLIVRLQELSQQIVVSTAIVQQAQKSLDQAKLACAANVEDLRSQLQPDSACPVCGSVDHPYQHQNNHYLQQLMTDFAQELEQHQHHHQQLRTEQIELIAEDKNNTAKLTLLSQEQQTKQLALQHIEQQLNTHSAQLMSIEKSQRDDWLKNQEHQLKQQIHQLHEQEAQARIALQHRELVQQQVNASKLLVDCATALFDYAQEARLNMELTQQRADYFDGESVHIIESKLQHDIQCAKNLHQQLDEQLRQVKESVIASIQQQQLISQRITELQSDTLQSHQTINEWLITFNQTQPFALDLSEIKANLVYDESWLQQQRQALQQLQTAITHAASQLNARHEDFTKHQLIKPNDLAEMSVLESQLSVLQTQLLLNQKQLGSIEQQLIQDKQRQQHTSALIEQLRQQQAQADIWQQLSSVMGSSDGKVFRNAAQQMTLDVLLFYTNGHLKDLAKRYRLERVAKSLGLQVIDQDMGDEVRSVHSLSGGESFLVSLALALGLASLSSQRVKVESLFIDEGFGSLDAETLRVAMDALDILQSQGRKVGVISHVAEMTERIPTQIQVRKGAGGKSTVHVIP